MEFTPNSNHSGDLVKVVSIEKVEIKGKIVATDIWIQVESSINLEHLLFLKWYQVRALFCTLLHIKWRPSSISELTIMIFNMGSTHLGSESSK